MSLAADDPLDIALHVTVDLELPGGWLIGSIALGALTDILARLEHDGIRPFRTTVEITDATTR